MEISKPRRFSGLEIVPPELFLLIVEDCTFPDLISLWKCSKLLSRRLNPLLFDTEDVRHHVMRHACRTGDLQLLNAAISHGADVSLIIVKAGGASSSQDANTVPVRELGLLHARPQDVYPSSVPESPVFTFRFSTLSLAARKGQRQIFEALIELGATFDGVDEGHLDDFKLFLVTPSGCTYIRAILKTQRLVQGAIGSSPIFFIRKRVPESVIHDIIDSGLTDLNEVELIIDMGHRRLYSPLSAAIERGSADLVRRLVRGGADIQGRNFALSDEPGAFTRPHHIPIFAAAWYLGKTGDYSMMDLCLELGADINIAMSSGLPGIPYMVFEMYWNSLPLTDAFWTRRYIWEDNFKAYLETYAIRPSTT